MADWTLRAYPVVGDGQNYPASAGDLKAANVKITESLNAASMITADIAITPDLVIGGDYAIGRWRTEVVANQVDPLGNILGTVSGLVTNAPIKGDRMPLEVVGYHGFLKDRPATTEYYGVDVDPVFVFRKAWADAQAYTVGGMGSNLGVSITGTTSTGVRIGRSTTTTNYTTGLGENVTFSDGPVKVTPWDVPDLAQFLEQLATDTPFDWMERPRWAKTSTGLQLVREIQIGYPRLGKVRTDIRFRTGEALAVQPDEDGTAGDDWCNVLMAFGRGEGKQALRLTTAKDSGPWIPQDRSAWGALPPRGLLRLQSWTDKTRATTPALQAAAEAELRKRRAPMHVTSLRLRDHAHAPFGSYHPGDEVLVVLDVKQGAPLQCWVRIKQLTWEVGKAEVSATVETIPPGGYGAAGETLPWVNLTPQIPKGLF